MMSSHKNILSGAGIRSADELLLMSQKEKEKSKEKVTGTTPKTAKKEDDFKVTFMKGDNGVEGVDILVDTASRVNGGGDVNKRDKVWDSMSKGEKFKKLVQDKKRGKKAGDIELDTMELDVGNKLD